MSNDPFTPPSAELDNGTEIIYAGFWRRVGASLIDTIILLLVMLPLLFMLFGSDYFNSETDEMGFSSPLDVMINYIIPIGITIFFWVKFRATPGKMLLGCIVVNAQTGENLGVGRSIVRYFAYFISTIVLFLGFFWVAFDKRKQGWHDKIAGTLVLRKGSALPRSNA